MKIGNTGAAIANCNTETFWRGLRLAAKRCQAFNQIKEDRTNERKGYQGRRRLR